MRSGTSAKVLIGLCQENRMELNNAARPNQPDDPSPPVQHPEAVIADDIVRIFPPQQSGAPALIKPVGKIPMSLQVVPAKVVEQIERASGYFRARQFSGAWVIADAPPDQGWE